MADQVLVKQVMTADGPAPIDYTALANLPTVNGAAIKGSVIDDVLSAQKKTIDDQISEVNGEVADVKSQISELKGQVSDAQGNLKGAVTTIMSDNLTANRTLVSDGSGKVAVSAVTSTELGYLDGVTSAIQTQLDSKAPKGHASTDTTYGVATEDNYGHVKLSDSTSSTSAASASIAASPKAVKAAYDLANTAKTNAATAQSTANAAQTSADNVKSMFGTVTKIQVVSALPSSPTANVLYLVKG